MISMKIKQESIITWAADLAYAYQALDQTDKASMNIFVYDRDQEAFEELELEQMASAFNHLDHEQV